MLTGSAPPYSSTVALLGHKSLPLATILSDVVMFVKYASSTLLAAGLLSGGFFYIEIIKMRYCGFLQVGS
ncbi:hypothetical protein [Janthinobacterium sp. LB3P118]|uniref:hypothetical protein n=1 Tax=Janthinobacterium sp. LB3P118 TaxID=3424195 RepID=UPI003F1F91F0